MTPSETARAAKAIHVPIETLERVLAGDEPSWPRLRRELAAHLGVERCELFPDHAAYDAAYDAGLARRAEQGLPPTVTDSATLDRVASLFADASAARATRK